MVRWAWPSPGGQGGAEGGEWRGQRREERGGPTRGGRGLARRAGLSRGKKTLTKEGGAHGGRPSQEGRVGAKREQNGPQSGRGGAPSRARERGAGPVRDGRGSLLRGGAELGRPRPAVTHLELARSCRRDPAPHPPRAPHPRTRPAPRAPPPPWAAPPPRAPRSARGSWRAGMAGRGGPRAGGGPGGARRRLLSR